MRRNIPNAITVLRMLCATAMATISIDQSLFWKLYALCGVSDALDGFLARRLHVESKLGSKLDSIADLAFMAVCTVKLLPQLRFPAWSWGCIASIAALQTSAIVAARIWHCPPELHHSTTNRLTGLLLFCLLPFYQRPNWNVQMFMLYPIAIFAAAQQLAIIYNSIGGKNMATTTEYMHYVCERLEAFGSIRAKKMFGEYMVYLNDKPILSICDNTVFAKKLPEIEALMRNADCGLPYEGAKEQYILDIDDDALLQKLVPILEAVIPLPKPRAKKAKV